LQYRIAADVLVILHLTFALFVAFGGFFVIRRPRLALVHIPIAIYGAVIELVGFVCPLTPLENRLRRLGGEAGYAGGFIENYVLHVLYPEGMTRNVSVALGLLVILINVAAYAVVIRRGRTAHKNSKG